MKLRRFLISPEFFKFGYTQDLSYKMSKGLPAHAQFKSWAFDYERNCIVVFMEHESFEDVPEGKIVPLGDLLQFDVIEPSRTSHKWPDDETIVDAANFHDHKCDSYSFIKGVQWLKSFVEKGSSE